MNPQIANNPRWVWETAAVRDAFPTLQQLVRLIQTNADLPLVLGLSAGELESAWQSDVRQRYLS